MFIFLSTWKTTCLNAVILDHHFSLWHLVLYWETVKATYFSLHTWCSFFHSALKIHSLSLKSDIIRLFLYIDCFLLFFPFQFTHSWNFVLISWNFSSIISISEYIFSFICPTLYIRVISHLYIDCFCLSSISITLYLII